MQTTIFGKFLIWRLRHLSHRKFILILSVILGLLGGLAAVILKTVVHYTQHLLKTRIEVEFGQMDKLLTVQEAAKFLGISRTTIYRYAERSEKNPHKR